MIVDVIFPLLCTTKEEYLQMIDEPQEFVSLALDTVDKQVLLMIYGHLELEYSKNYSSKPPGDVL